MNVRNPPRGPGSRWESGEGSIPVEDQSALQRSLRKIALRLNELGIPYAVVSGVVPFHGARRFTEVLDLLVTRAGLKLIHEKLVGAGYQRSLAKGKNLRDTELGVKIAFLVSGEFPGDGKPKPVAFPDPISASHEANGVRYLNLISLIELKLASGMTSVGRLTDLSDVLELIKTLDIPLDYADALNPYVREKFRELWQTARRQFTRIWRAEVLNADTTSLDDMIERLGAEVEMLKAMKEDGVILDADRMSNEDVALLSTCDPEMAQKYGMEEPSEFWPDDGSKGQGDDTGMPQEPGPPLRITRRFDDSPERVFDAWLDPETVNKWPFTLQAREKSGTRIESRVGGTWSITGTYDGEEHTAVGEYLEIDRPRRLVISFSMFSSRFGRVIVELAPAQSGCNLTLTHEGLRFEDHREIVKAWSDLFDALETRWALSAGHGVVTGPGTVRFERLLPGPIERVWAYLTETDLRGKWLAIGAMRRPVGSAFELRFHHASLSSNRVLPSKQFKVNERGYVSQHRLTRWEPPVSLGFTWGRGDDAPSAVSFELTPQGDEVLLTLTHQHLGNRAAMTDVACGWHAHLTLLIERLNGREPPSFWSLFAANKGEYERRFALINGTALTPKTRFGA